MHPENSANSLNSGSPYDTRITIKSWAEDDRPREKLAGQGRRALSDAELIAILIGSGNRDETAVELSKRILHHYGNDLNNLGKASIEELSQFKGIGEAKAISIIAALEVGRRRNDTEPQAIEKVATSKDAYLYLKRFLIDLNHEEFWLLLLGQNCKILGKELISKGGLTATIADPKIIFGVALRYAATSIMLAHNHPSGNLKPSQQDLELTRKLVAAGRMLDMKVLDHLIITDAGYYSFADEGVM